MSEQKHDQIMDYEHGPKKYNLQVMSVLYCKHIPRYPSLFFSEIRAWFEKGKQKLFDMSYS